MKYLVVGLGNKGDEYADTRHNIGFKVADYLAAEHGTVFTTKRLGAIAPIKHKGRTLILLKPSTYMNRSGSAIQYWLRQENIAIENLIIIVDDIHVNFGQVRIRDKGSDGGHNGLKDIGSLIGSNYTRLRIGIGNEFSPGRQVNYVLGVWSEEEKRILPAIIKHSADACLSYCFRGIKETMSAYNGKVPVD